VHGFPLHGYTFRRVLKTVAPEAEILRR